VITPDDLLAAARHSRAALTPLQGAAGWDRHPADLDWTCRDTLDHVVDAISFYAACLARRATVRPTRPREGAPQHSPAQLLDCLDSVAAVLAAVIRDAAPGARAHHRAGMADGSGFAAMACAEILVHTEDVAATLGDGYRGPDDLTDRVVQRLFPWAPPHDDPWQLFRWCTGRAALPANPRQGPDWFWWCAPLDEWTGGRTIRSMSQP